MRKNTKLHVAGVVTYAVLAVTLLVGGANAWPPGQGPARDVPYHQLKNADGTNREGTVTISDLPGGGTLVTTTRRVNGKLVINQAEMTVDSVTLEGGVVDEFWFGTQHTVPPSDDYVRIVIDSNPNAPPEFRITWSTYEGGLLVSTDTAYFD